MTTINEYKILDTYSPQNKIRLSEIVLDLYSSNSKLMILGGYSKIDIHTRRQAGIFWESG